MGERILRNRKRKKASKGQLVRISDLVYNTLQKKRSNNRRISWDSLFRQMLGLPDREGNEQPVVEGWLEVTSGKFYLEEDAARGAAVMEAARNKTKKVNAPLKMREVI